MSIPLAQILKLVGDLEDSPPNNKGSQARFRDFLQTSVQTVAQLRDYTDECLAQKGDQYSRALQDLAAWVGTFLGFEVEFGRYQGVHGQIGFDALWHSPQSRHVVIEVKTTAAYVINTATLDGYIGGLIAAKRIPNRESALGLYVLGRHDPGINQLESSILQESRNFRIVMLDALLSLADLMATYEVSHRDILALLLPSGPRVDPVVDLIARLLAQLPEAGGGNVPVDDASDKPVSGDEPQYWMTPVRSDDDLPAEKVIQDLVGTAHHYAYGDKTPGRARLKPGDRICFYATGTGVVAYATVASVPARGSHPAVRNPERYPWLFQLREVHVDLQHPVVVDATLRAELDAFKGKDPNRPWAWFVQATRHVSADDFRRLTRAPKLVSASGS